MAGQNKKNIKAFILAVVSLNLLLVSSSAYGEKIQNKSEQNQNEIKFFTPIYPRELSKFPDYMQNNLVIRITDEFGNWLKSIFDLILNDTSSNYCKQTIYKGQFSGGGFNRSLWWPNSNGVPTQAIEYLDPANWLDGCGYKFLNFVNALLVSFLDAYKDNSDKKTWILCCCDSSQDPENCNVHIKDIIPADASHYSPEKAIDMSPGPGCPPLYPMLGECLKLDPKATNYYMPFVANPLVDSHTSSRPHMDDIVYNFIPWRLTKVVDAPPPVTWAWEGMLDQNIPIPLIGNVAINLTLNDVCNPDMTPKCGPPMGYSPGQNFNLPPPYHSTPDLWLVYLNGNNQWAELPGGGNRGIGFCFLPVPRHTYEWIWIDEWGGLAGDCSGRKLYPPDVPPPYFDSPFVYVYHPLYKDGYIIRWKVISGMNPKLSIGIEEGGKSCGIVHPIGECEDFWIPHTNQAYDWKVITGKEGMISLSLQIGDFNNPVYIDVDAVGPSNPSRVTFSADDLAVQGENIAPGKIDCDPDRPGHQGDCYVRAYLLIRAALKLKLGLSLVLEHDINPRYHEQNLGLRLIEIDFASPPFISFSIDWAWTEKSSDPSFDCSSAAPGFCKREKITEKARTTVQFLDAIFRGLFSFYYIRDNLQKYFSPIAISLTGMTRQRFKHLFPTWSRPKKIDDIIIDLSLGGEDIGGNAYTGKLRAKACYVKRCFSRSGTCTQTGSELWLISSSMIDFNFIKSGKDEIERNDIPACGYLGPSYYPAQVRNFLGPGTWSWFYSPTGEMSPSFSPPLPTYCDVTTGLLPFAGYYNQEIFDLILPAPHIAISFHENFFSYAISDFVTEGLACVVVHDDQNAEKGIFENLPIKLRAGNFKPIIPELYSFLKEEFGEEATDIPLIFVLKPKVGKLESIYPADTPVANFKKDYNFAIPNWIGKPDSPSNPSDISEAVDILFYLPNNDLEIWVDVDKNVEQWGGPNSLDPSNDPTSFSGNPSFKIQSYANCVSGVGPVPPDTACELFGNYNGFIMLPKYFTQTFEVVSGWFSGWAMANFVNNFPDCVSYIDCDNGVPSDKIKDERRFIGEFDIGLRFGVDLDILGCGRASGHFSNWFLNTWLDGATCTVLSTKPIPYLRRLYLNFIILSDLLRFDPTNDVAPNLWSSNPQYIRTYYSFSGGTYSAFIIDIVGILLEGMLSAKMQVGFTMKEIFDSDDEISVCDIITFEDNNPCGTASHLGLSTRFARDDWFWDPPGLNKHRWLSFAFSLEGKLHPNFFFKLISDGLSGNLDGFLGAPILKDVNHTSSTSPLHEILQEISNKIKNIDVPISKLKDILKEIDDYYISDTENLPIDRPPETFVDAVHVNGNKITVKLSCVDDKTSPENCWYSYKVGNMGWTSWIKKGEFEIILPDGEHEISVRAYDEAGWIDFTPESFKVKLDTSPPDIFAPKNKVVKPKQAIRFAMWDNLTPPEKIKFDYKLYVDGKELNSSYNHQVKINHGKAELYIIAPKGEENLKVKIYASDEKGNKTEETFIFYYEKKNLSPFSCSSQ